jgi:hypothetical protein
MEARRRAKLDDEGRQASGMDFYSFQVCKNKSKRFEGAV